MRGHLIRNAYYVRGEGVIVEPDFVAGSGGSGCPSASRTAGKGAVLSALGFGRMFPKSSIDPKSQEFKELHDALIDLGQKLNTKPNPPAPDSDIPAGYTYLGQYVAHEITYDKQDDIPYSEPHPKNSRSPTIDLDSLYGDGPDQETFYEPDRASLKMGKTTPISINTGGCGFLNDLYRDESGEAQIPDPRNDENLAVAQTHVAFSKFHNNVVAVLKEEGTPPDKLFARARTEVIRHFQWLVLNDFLPRIVDTSVLDCVLKHGRKWFKVMSAADLYMPLEFSAAAFRLGHSMVRNHYRWNRFHTDNEPGSSKQACLLDLFEQTHFSGGIQAGVSHLPGDWVIDWRHFFKFEGKNWIDDSRRNLAAKIDTKFDFLIGDKLPPSKMAPSHKPIPVRNLLRGLALSLPTGEDVARWIGETPLNREQVIAGPQEDILTGKLFHGKTPLWYYILKEAELIGGNHLGPVGSRIVAETLVGLVKYSKYSILAEPRGMFAWQPSKYGTRFSGDGKPIFEMTDLLEFADAVNPYTGP